MSSESYPYLPPSRGSAEVHKSSGCRCPVHVPRSLCLGLDIGNDRRVVKWSAFNQMLCLAMKLDRHRVQWVAMQTMRIAFRKHCSRAELQTELPALLSRCAAIVTRPSMLPAPVQMRSCPAWQAGLRRALRCVFSCATCGASTRRAQRCRRRACARRLCRMALCAATARAAGTCSAWRWHWCTVPAPLPGPGLALHPALQVRLLIASMLTLFPPCCSASASQAAPPLVKCPVATCMSACHTHHHPRENDLPEFENITAYDNTIAFPSYGVLHSPAKVWRELKGGLKIRGLRPHIRHQSTGSRINRHSAQATVRRQRQRAAGRARAAGTGGRHPGWRGPFCARHRR